MPGGLGQPVDEDGDDGYRGYEAHEEGVGLQHPYAPVLPPLAGELGLHQLALHEPAHEDRDQQPAEREHDLRGEEVEPVEEVHGVGAE